MSTGSSVGSLERRNARPRARLGRLSTNKIPLVSRFDAYTYALRAAYLHHLLQPKARRLQHVPAPKPQSTAQSVTDLVRDSLTVRDPKSTRFPRDFMKKLDKRLTDVLYGKEKMPGFADPAVIQTFAIFINEFKKPEFRSSAEKDRKVEDLLLIFFASATKQLSKTKKAPDDESWKLMVDRHVALFVRFISAILRENDWARDKPELASRLQTLESKLLAHDQDLAADSHRNGGAGGATVEVEVPRSALVKDMPLVLTVAAVFGKELATAQGDIDDQKDLWTERTALRDLKMYQTSLSINDGRSLRADDFDSEEAYENWRKPELQELAQMITAVVRSNTALAKSTQNPFSPATKVTSPTANGNSTPTHSRMSSTASYFSRNQSAELGRLKLNGDAVPTSPSGAEIDNSEPFMFIPDDPRSYYREVVKNALLHDVKESPTDMSYASLSKNSHELLNEIGMRWRVPLVSRLIMLQDVARELVNDQAISLDTLDTILSFVKEPCLDGKKPEKLQLPPHSQWPSLDFVRYQQLLTSIHETLMRDLFEQLLRCYDTKPPDIAPIMAILEGHIYEDPMFTKHPQELERFRDHLREALFVKSREAYDAVARQHLSQEAGVEFYHIIQLGKAVFKLAERIQKRYRKNSEIMGVKPAPIFIEVVLPAFATDARDQIAAVIAAAEAREEEIPMDDGFELYKEMVEIRQIHSDVLPNIPFAFQVEDLLAPFVWRWIKVTDESIIGWVEAAVRQDDFKVRNELPDVNSTEDERHSVSVIDVFRSFNEAMQQIVSLNWDDDYQYAKFMTALSKSIGAGLAKYCEQLDKFFAAEMDRLTPEQEADRVQTRQEKWMKAARGAISNKEKVEPFQFMPESFVKLNDIEWAMLQLDKLEREINVDACAAVIEKIDPPALPKRRAETFVFTIKIIEAEDLKACDMNGLSDPYVVLGDEYQKRLAKTRIIYGNLNPRWDESIDITTQGPLNVIATIWDWDAMGEHDCVGRASIKLDPSHFRDFLPREYWLDLDTQGRLLVRVSMEGEKDDIRFYFGRAFRTLKRTEREMTRKITDKLSAYIHHCLSRRTLKALTSTGITLSAVSNYFQRNRAPPPQQPVSQADIEGALTPLISYFNDNFAIMKQTLTENAMISVMSRLWKETLSTLESLLVPPLSDKPSAQRQLAEQEFEIVFKWMQMLFDFFHAVDDETKVAQGVPLDVLRSAKYHDLKNLNFFYYEPTESLVKTSERMAVATMHRQRDAQARANRQSAPTTMLGPPSFAGAIGLAGLPSTRRSKTVMHSRNLGTMRKAKEDKRREAQAEPSDDMIMRILRMRPEAERYLRDRSRQKERLAASAAAEQIVRQSMAQGAARDQEIRREMAIAAQQRRAAG